jgi:hypothetical protein
VGPACYHFEARNVRVFTPNIVAANYTAVPTAVACTRLCMCMYAAPGFHVWERKI